MLGKTFPAIHRTIFSGFERNFALFFAVRTDGFMHLSRTSVVSSILKIHVLSLLILIPVQISVFHCALTWQSLDCLLPVLPLERKRSLPGTGTSSLVTGAILIKVSLSRITLSRVVPVFSLAVSLRMVEGTKRFRKRSFSEGPVRGRFFPRWPFLRLIEQQIYLSLQQTQLLLHALEQGHNANLGWFRFCNCVNARLFIHLTWFPFTKTLGFD